MWLSFPILQTFKVKFDVAVINLLWSQMSLLTTREMDKIPSKFPSSPMLSVLSILLHMLQPQQHRQNKAQQRAIYSNPRMKFRKFKGGFN